MRVIENIQTQTSNQTLATNLNNVMRCIVIASLVVLIAGCGEKESAQSKSGEYENFGPAHPDPAVTVRILENGEPSHITVQHILIAYRGAIDKPIDRDLVGAEKLAKEVFEEAKTADDFSELVKKYTDDAFPGIYKLANFTIDGNMNLPNKADWIYERGGMVPAFGNVGFKLKVGEVGLADHDSESSPYGWHIIKRIK